MTQAALLVDCHKIITWLQDRKKLPKDWYNAGKAAQEKIKVLLKDSSQFGGHQTKNLQDYINQNENTFYYGDVLKLTELLEQSNLAKEKSMLFGYSDKRVKQWITLKKFMSKNLVGVVNTGKFIQQTLNFDLPGIDKGIEAMDSQLSNLKRKIDYNRNTIYQQKIEFDKENQALGIQNSQKGSLEEMLLTLIKNIPHHINRVEEKYEYIKLYQEANERNGTECNNLSMLCYFMEQGNQFYSVFKKYVQKEAFSQVRKYSELDHWRPKNVWQIEVQGEISKGKEQRLDLTTILQNKKTRQSLINDLNQLLYFFKGVLYEIESSSKSLGLMSEKQNQMIEADAKTACLKILEVIDLLNSKKLVTAFEIKNNKKSYQILFSRLSNYEVTIGTMQQQILKYQEQIEGLKVSRLKEVQRLRTLQKKVYGAKNMIESWIEELLKRKVKITGSVNQFE